MGVVFFLTRLCFWETLGRQNSLLSTNARIVQTRLIQERSDSHARDRFDVSFRASSFFYINKKKKDLAVTLGANCVSCPGKENKQVSTRGVVYLDLALVDWFIN